MCVCVCVCVCMCVRACTYICVCMYTNIYMHVCIYVCYITLKLHIVILDIEIKMATGYKKIFITIINTVHHFNISYHVLTNIRNALGVI